MSGAATATLAAPRNCRRVDFMSVSRVEGTGYRGHRPRLNAKPFYSEGQPIVKTGSMAIRVTPPALVLYYRVLYHKHMEKKSRFHDYLPVGERELDWGLYVTVAGFNHVLPDEPFPSPGHPLAYQFDPTVGRVLPEYQLIFFSKGQGTFSSEETGTVDLVAGTAVLLFPGVWHTYRPAPQTGWEDYWIGFNGSYVYELCRRKILSAENPLYRPPQRERLIESFENMLEAIRKEPVRNSMLYSAKAVEILALTLENRSEIKEERLGKEKIIDEAVQMIWGWSYRFLGVADIARRLGIQRRTLERYFREIRGTTILGEIMQCRLSRACRLLENTRVPLGQIALMTGFSSTQQMRRNFRDIYGKTPEQFRKNMKHPE